MERIAIDINKLLIKFPIKRGNRSDATLHTKYYPVFMINCNVLKMEKESYNNRKFAISNNLK